jgi:hypothetical protein
MGALSLRLVDNILSRFFAKKNILNRLYLPADRVLIKTLHFAIRCQIVGLACLVHWDHKRRLPTWIKPPVTVLRRKLEARAEGKVW